MRNNSSRSYKYFVIAALGYGVSFAVGDSKIAMQLYASLLSIISIAIVTRDAKKDPATLLSCMSLVLLAPIWFIYLEAIIPDRDCWLLPADAVIRTLSFCAAFLGLFLLFYRFKPPKRVISLHEKNFLRILNPNLLPVFGIAFTILLFFAVLARYGFDWELVKTVYAGGRDYGSGGIIKRGGIGGSEIFLQPLGFMAPMVPTFAALSWVKFGGEAKAALSLRILVTLCGLFLIFVMFLGGSRGNMAIYLAGPTAIWIIYGKRAGIFFWPVSVAAFLLLIGIWEYQVRHRSHLLRGVDSMEDFVENTTFDPTKSHRDNNLYIFTLHEMYMPRPHRFQGPYELFYLAVNPIPRAIWKGKPKGIHENEGTFQFVRGPVAMGPIRIGTASLSASIICDGFKMMHLFGIAIYAFIFGSLASMWDTIGQKRLFSSKLYFILNSAWLFWFLWGFRAAFAFVTGMYAVWGAYLFCFVAGKFGKHLILNRSSNQSLAASSKIYQSNANLSKALKKRLKYELS